MYMKIRRPERPRYAVLSAATILVLLLALPLGAQDALSLEETVRQAVAHHPSIEASAAGIKAAEERVRAARGGFLPRLNYAESYQRSDNPVFVFSSLLTQHQFTADNFALGPLNRPDALNNFQSQLTVDQTIYDAGLTRSQIHTAELSRGVAEENDRRAHMGLIARAAGAYYQSVLSAELLKVAHEAVRSAEADLTRAEAVRKAGMSTDADVLSMRVHLAAMREQEIRRSYGAQVARAALNEALGLPLDTEHTLTTPLTTFGGDQPLPEDSSRKAAGQRPEVREAQLSSSLAEAQAGAARAALFPQVSMRGAFEADRQRFADRGGANWFLGVSVHWNLFNGNSDKARIREAAQALRGARAYERQIAAQVGLEVRSAYAELKSARERITVAGASAAEAEESLRITRNRYQAGLTTVTDLLQKETASLDARTRQLAAVFDQRLAAVALAMAEGTLTEDSDVVR
jgi:outer membrane protein